MSDPGQVIQQFERYAQEGRLEIAEVMSTELAQRLLVENKRDLELQTFLVRTLRGNANILVLRGKHKLAAKACALLLKHSNNLRRMAKASKRQDLVDICLDARAGDRVLCARAAIGLGRLGSASRHLRKAARAKPNHVEAPLLALEGRLSIKGNLRSGGSDVKRLATALRSAGAVISRSGVQSLEPAEQEPVELSGLLGRLDALSDSAGLDQKSGQVLANSISTLREQQQAILAGEQVSNAKLAAAIDTLNPTMDYHSYSRGN